MSWLEGCKGTTGRLAHYGFTPPPAGDYKFTSRIRQLTLESCDYRWSSTSVIVSRIPFCEQPARHTARNHLNKLVKEGILEKKKGRKNTRVGGSEVDLWRKKQ